LVYEKMPPKGRWEDLEIPEIAFERNLVELATSDCGYNGLSLGRRFNDRSRQQ
jgi:hypothetical protein